MQRVAGVNVMQANANIEHPLFDAVGRMLYAYRTGENLELRIAELRASYYAHESLHRLEAIQTYHNLAREAEEAKNELRREVATLKATVHNQEAALIAYRNDEELRRDSF